ncbi:MAG: GntR family transcriptional regulator [Rhodospirillales bacterium]|nr:GntR family transcriptional regulator [Rhodospirillales bacterium]
MEPRNLAMDCRVDSYVGCSTFTKINLRQPMVPQVYAAMRSHIIDLTWRPGQFIAKADVAEALGVSQSPVREALLKLEADGLVEIVPRSRTVVSAIDIRHAAEAQFLRVCIEVEVVRTIANANTFDAEATGVAAILKRQDFYASQGDLSGFAACDNEFHASLCRLAGVGGLWSVVMARRSHIDRLRHLDLPSRGKVEAVLSDHQAILAALIEGSAAKAEAAVRAHLAGTLGRAEGLKTRYPQYFETHQEDRQAS